MTSGKAPTPRIEEYLESIANLNAEGKPVVAARLAERLELTAATVSATIRRMVRDGLISISSSKEIFLTEKGTRLALAVLRRHRLAEKLLRDVLGVEWHEVHEEACLLEHAISAKVEERLDKVLNNPITCPHGNPIPNGGSLPSPKGIPLGAVAPGTTVRVERITEEAARNPKLMEYLYRVGVIPGAIFRIEKVDHYAETASLKNQEREITLGLSMTDTLWVTPLTSS